LTLSEQWYFVFDTVSQSTKWQETLEILGVMALSTPLRVPHKRFFGGKSCACFRNKYNYFNLQVIFNGQMT